METAVCFVCGVGGVVERCGLCEEVWYCQPHRHGHVGQGVCYPFRVEDSKEAGRYLVATRTISKGEVVMSDYPVVCGPIYTRSKPACMNCLKLATAESYRCSKCEFPVCDPECEDGVWHKDECSVFQAAGFKADITSCQEFCPVYSCITPLRLLLLKKFSRPAWSIVDTFMDHDEDRARKDSPAWKIHEILVVNFIQKSLKLSEFSHTDIRRAIGILRTNSAKLDMTRGYGDGVAVYPTYSYTNHSCVCNSLTKKYHKDHKLELVAQSQINPGDQIWTRYTTPQLGTFQRVSDIQKTWHFACSCARCQDPTEFGTMMSAVRCTAADCKGYLLPKCPTLVGSPWRCDTCSKTVGISGVQTVMKMVLDDIGKHRDEDNESLLNVIKKQEEFVHPNHYLINGVKEIIIQRLMMTIREYNSGVSKSSPEEILAAYKLRTSLFRDVATILQTVDSVGAGWLEKLHKMAAEEQAKIGEIRKNDTSS